MQKIEYIKISLLKPHPQNPRLIKDDNFKILCESIRNNKDYFETRPILCNKEMVVFAGNMRLRGAKEIGMTEVPCSIMDISEDRQNELMLRDNKENGEWDYNMLANCFDMDLLSSVGFSSKDFGLPDFTPATEDEQGDLGKKDKKVVTCPACSHEFTP
jgi:hypothetical protein